MGGVALGTLDSYEIIGIQIHRNASSDSYPPGVFFRGIFTLERLKSTQVKRALWIDGLELVARP